MAASAIGAAGTILDEYGHKVEREVNKELGKTVSRAAGGSAE